MNPPLTPHTFVDIHNNPMKNATKASILHTCIELFAHSGYSAVSIREITRNVGIKESSLYNHFRNKNEIIETIYTNYRMELARILPSMEKVDELIPLMEPEVFMQQGFTLFKMSYNNPTFEKMWRIVQIEQFRDVRARDIYLNDICNNTLLFVEQVFQKLINMGKMKPLDPTDLAAAYQYPVFAMMIEYYILKCDQKDTSLLEKRMNNHIQQFFQNNLTS
ncbi:MULTISPECIES: TetR/AcrR family transcriptional regulator [Paenibacillus]|nr:TetR/AcrR family transcriptional regulator [Paenibacillus anaericanus]